MVVAQQQEEEEEEEEEGSFWRGLDEVKTEEGAANICAVVQAITLAERKEKIYPVNIELA